MLSHINNSLRSNASTLLYYMILLTLIISNTQSQLTNSISTSSNNIIYSCFDEDIKTSDGVTPTKVTFPSSFNLENKVSSFMIKERIQICPNGEFIASKKLLISSSASNQIDTSLKTASASSSKINLAGENTIEYFTQNGFIKIANEYFNSEEYCIQKLEKYSISLKVCQNPCTTSNRLTRNSFCIPKCCNLDKVLDFSPGGIPHCLSTSSTSSNLLTTNLGSFKVYDSSGIVEKESLQHFVVQNIFCGGGNSNLKYFSLLRNDTFLGIEKSQFKILQNGNVVLLRNDQDKEAKKGQLNSDIMIPFGHYCVDTLSLSANSENNLKTIYFSSTENNNFNNMINQDQILITCSDSLLPDESSSLANLIIPILYCIFMFISILLLLTTIFIHILLWENQKFHMWVVLSYVSSLLFMYVFLGVSNIIQFYSNNSISFSIIGDNEKDSNFGCILIGATSHLFLLSTFFWLTLINENLWTTFRALSIPNSSHLLEETRIIRFIWFSLFAWGIPIIIVSCGLGMDYFYKNEPQQQTSFIFLLPNYGANHVCLLSQAAEGWYLYYPIGLLLSFNVIFFGLTIIRLILYSRIMKNTIGERYDTKWTLVNIYLKLLLCALFIWAFEVITWLLKLESFTPYYWMIIESFNLIQSLLIFSMFICRISILKQLGQKYTRFYKIISALCPEALSKEQVGSVRRFN